MFAGLLAAALSIAPVAAGPPGQFGGRPILPGEETHGTGHFLIHYTRTGQQAISPADADGSGVPDYVELVAETLEHVWDVEVGAMGWPTPPGDRGEGGDTRLDVYLDEILADGYAGYVDTEGGFLGDNPQTPERERRAAYAYLVLDDDFIEVDVETGETPTELMQATVAHEFNHILQAGIDDQDLHAWLYEATATWMEDEVYDDVNDGVFYLDSVFKNPDICLVAEVARGDDLHWYGTWLLVRMLSERYGPGVVLSIWENMRQFNGFGSVDAALLSYGESLVSASRDFAAANLLRAYEEGSAYPTVHVEAEIGLGSYASSEGVQSLGADYLRLSGSGPLTVSLTGAQGPLSLRAVGIRGSAADVIDMVGNALSLNRDDYDDVYLIVHNGEQVGLEDECAFAGYTLNVSASSASPSAVAAVWPAANFQSPLESPVIAAASGGTGTYRPPDAPFGGGTDEYASSPEGLVVPFETLIPAFLPPGYVFDYAYIMTEADFGQNAIYYVPGGGDTANFDYLDAEGNWLSIAESPSPYATVQEWIEGIGYYDTPGEIITVEGVDVLLEDLSDPSEVWFSATLILDGLFIVVDGDHSKEAVIELVRGLIAAVHSADIQPAAPPTQAAPPTATAAPLPAPLPPAPLGSETLEMLFTGIGFALCAAGACVAGLVGLVFAGVFLFRRRR